MKILKVAFNNINSLRGAHAIDFTREPFRSNSLFAITGPTGSGKSTILDVIALALFNQVPRLGGSTIAKGDIDKKGALLTRNQKEAHASVTYSCKSGVYTSTWSISTNRNGNLRDHHMEIAVEGTDEILDLKKSRVPSKNEELIGLNYNQFIKSVMLAQGEFAQLLQAKKDERGELLEKITGTGMYRLLGRMAHERHKEENGAIKSQIDRIAALKPELLEPEVFQEKQEVLEVKERETVPLEKSIEGLQKSLSLKETLKQQATELATLDNQKEKAHAGLGEFDAAYGERLKQQQQLEPHRDTLHTWGNQHAQLREIELEQRSQIQKLEEVGKAQISVKKNVEELIRQEIGDDTIDEVLQGFAKKVDELSKNTNKKREEFKATLGLFNAEAKNIDFKLTNSSKESAIDEDLNVLERKKRASQSQLDQLKIKLEGIDINNLEQEENKIKQLIRTLHEAGKERDKIKQLTQGQTATNEELKKLTETLALLQPQLKEAIVHRDKFTEEVAKLKLAEENKILRASLVEHRQHLADGDPCPLCGALEHPYSTYLPDSDDGSQQVLAQAEANFAAWNKKSISLKTELDLGKRNKTKFEAILEESNRTLLDAKAGFTERFEGLSIDPDTDLDKDIEIQNGQLELLDQLSREFRINEALGTSIPILIQLKSVLLEGKLLGNELKDLYSGNDIYKETTAIQNQWISLSEQRNNLTAQRKSAIQKGEAIRKAIEAIESQLIPQLQALGFDGIAKSLDAQLPHEELDELKKQRETLQTALTSFNASLETLSKQHERSKENDVEESQETLIKNLEEKRSTLNKLRQTLEGLRRSILNHKELIATIAKLETAIADKEKHIKRWRLLNDLIGDATGNKFNKFAQDLTLSQLLSLANTRLKDLSDRYQVDKPLDDEDDSLVAIDQHMGGQRRSVKTLSGGETFILSLSMALALSDLASRNVEINSLFIDEGFGTLDPDALDQTLDTLERLQAESSKTIGIISHVDSLKERIGTQIQLTRNGQGYSTLSIKG